MNFLSFSPTFKTLQPSHAFTPTFKTHITELVLSYHLRTMAALSLCVLGSLMTCETIPKQQQSPSVLSPPQVLPLHSFG